MKIPNLGQLVQAAFLKLKLTKNKEGTKVTTTENSVDAIVPDDPDEYTFRAAQALMFASKHSLTKKPLRDVVKRNNIEH